MKWYCSLKARFQESHRRDLKETEIVITLDTKKQDYGYNTCFDVRKGLRTSIRLCE